MQSPNAKLLDILHQVTPQRVLVISRSGVPALEEYQRHHSCELISATEMSLNDIAGLPAVDLILIADWLEYHRPEEGRLLLGALRNRLNPRILVALNDQQGRWSLTDFLALGFRRDGQFQLNEQSLSFYSYDIASYNQKRTWNNPDHWANPQNWGKYWW